MYSLSLSLSLSEQLIVAAVSQLAMQPADKLIQMAVHISTLNYSFPPKEKGGACFCLWVLEESWSPFFLSLIPVITKTRSLGGNFFSVEEVFLYFFCPAVAFIGKSSSHKLFSSLFLYHSYRICLQSRRESFRCMYGRGSGVKSVFFLSLSP